MNLRSTPWRHGAAALLLSACGSSTPAAFREAEGLEAQGKFEEAAAQFELTCAQGPEAKECAAADTRAAEARIKAAEKATTEGRFLAAERLLLSAYLTADDAAQKRVTEALAQDNLVQGLKFQRAIELGDKAKALPVVEQVALSPGPAAAKAKAWLDKERPAALIVAVKAACGPERQGSCSKAWREAAVLKGPEVEEVRALAEAEERRVYDLRLQAERFLAAYASQNQKIKAVEKCIQEKTEWGEVNDPLNEICTRNVFGEPRDYDSEKTTDNLFRRLLKSIGDPDLTAPLEERKKQAREGGTYAKLEISKPAGAPKKP